MGGLLRGAPQHTPLCAHLTVNTTGTTGIPRAVVSTLVGCVFSNCYRVAKFCFRFWSESCHTVSANGRLCNSMHTLIFLTKGVDGSAANCFICQPVVRPIQPQHFTPTRGSSAPPRLSTTVEKDYGKARTCRCEPAMTREATTSRLSRANQRSNLPF